MRPGREKNAGDVDLGDEAQQSRRQQHAEKERRDQKPQGLYRDGGDLDRREPVAVPIDGRDGAAHHGEDHEPDHVVDDRGPQNDAGLAALGRVQVAEYAGGDADARRGQHGAEEDVHVGWLRGKQPHACRPA